MRNGTPVDARYKQKYYIREASCLGQCYESSDPSGMEGVFDSMTVWRPAEVGCSI